jgi:two-component system response regulator EvgA
MPCELVDASENTLNVLLVDDNSLVREQVAHMLSRVEGLVISGMAENGVIALQTIRKTLPDVVVLDISMPFMNGIEVLEEIRRYKMPVTVIMYTGEASEQTRALCARAGADYFVYKGDFTKLREIFEGLVTGRR